MFLSQSQSCTWLKPRVFTSSTNAIGAPWEIYRPSFLAPLPRPIDHYTKQGNIPGYAAIIILVPEFDTVVTIAVAGEDAYPASVDLFNAVQAELVPRLDGLARKEAFERYGGRYAQGNSSLELVLDDGPGLKISKWSNLGKDMLFAFDSISFGGNRTMLDARIYPIGSGERWRVIFEENGREGGETVTSTTCTTWDSVDQLRYAGLPCDELDFQVGEGGEIVGPGIPGLRAHLHKA
jgi:hypothetical protein